MASQANTSASSGNVRFALPSNPSVVALEIYRNNAQTADPRFEGFVPVTERNESGLAILSKARVKATENSKKPYKVNQILATRMRLTKGGHRVPMKLCVLSPTWLKEDDPESLNVADFSTEKLTKLITDEFTRANLIAEAHENFDEKQYEGSGKNISFFFDYSFDVGIDEKKQLYKLYAWSLMWLPVNQIANYAKTPGANDAPVVAPAQAIISEINEQSSSRNFSTEASPPKRRRTNEEVSQQSTGNDDGVRVATVQGILHGEDSPQEGIQQSEGSSKACPSDEIIIVSDDDDVVIIEESDNSEGAKLGGKAEDKEEAEKEDDEEEEDEEEEEEEEEDEFYVSSLWDDEITARVEASKFNREDVRSNWPFLANIPNTAIDACQFYKWLPENLKHQYKHLCIKRHNLSIHYYISVEKYSPFFLMPVRLLYTTSTGRQMWFEQHREFKNHHWWMFANYRFIIKDTDPYCRCKGVKCRMCTKVFEDSDSE